MRRNPPLFFYWQIVESTEEWNRAASDVESTEQPRKQGRRRIYGAAEERRNRRIYSGKEASRQRRRIYRKKYDEKYLKKNKKNYLTCRYIVL